MGIEFRCDCQVTQFGKSPTDALDGIVDSEDFLPPGDDYGHCGGGRKADSSDDCEAFVGRSGCRKLGRQEVDKPFWKNAARYRFR